MPTWLLPVVLLHALQALQQIVHLVFDLREFPLDGLQVICLHCGKEEEEHKSWLLCRCDGAAQDSCCHDALVLPTRTGGPLAALGGRGGEAGFGSSAPSPAQTDPGTLGGNDRAGQGRRWRRHPGLVGVHPEIHTYKDMHESCAGKNITFCWKLWSSVVLP